MELAKPSPSSATFTVNVEVDDVGGSSAIVSSSVTGPTLPLTLINPGAQSSNEGDTGSMGLVVTGGDGAYSYSATGLPDGLTLDQTGLISGTVAYGDAAISGGTYSVTVSVTDNGTTVSQSFNWTVAAVPLTLTNPGDQTNNEQDSVDLPLTVVGGQTGTDTFTASGLPSDLSIDPDSGEITGTLDYFTAGSYAVTVSVSDGFTTTTQSFNWTVATVPLALANPGDQSNEGQDPVTLELFASGGESPGYTYSATNLPSGLSLDAIQGVISGTLDASAAVTNGGVYTVTLAAFDGYSTTSQVFTWTVVNASLTLANPGNQTNGEGDLVGLQLVAEGGQDSHGCKDDYPVG